MARPTILAMHVRSGTTALNVVTAALDADPRTLNCDVRFLKSDSELITTIREESARGVRPLVLWSFYSPDFEETTKDLATVRAATGDAALHVAGGVHATAEPLATLCAGFDLVALGEGEHTICEVVAALDEHGLARVRDLQGIAYLENGSLVSHGPGERHPLDRYPAINARYKKWNAFEITRGCVYACSFCQTPYMFKAKFRHRSIENVRTNIEMMHLSGSRYMRFLTPTSLSYGSDGTEVNLPAVDELLRVVREGTGKEAKIFFGTFPSEIRPEHITKESLEVLKRWIDNRTLVIGGQSGSDRILEETRRGHTVDHVVRAVELSVAAGFQPDVDFLLGLPGETEADRVLSMNLAARLVKMGARIHSHAFMPLPGTPLRDATPVPIEPATAKAMQKLEMQGNAYGHWRKQVVTADRLVRARRASS